MFARINHMAMISADYPLLERYYRSLFKFETSGRNDPEASTVVGDGNVGLNILPRRDGYMGGIDHFGMVRKLPSPMVRKLVFAPYGFEFSHHLL